MAAARAQILTLEGFHDEFSRLTRDWSWEVLGIEDDNSRIHPLDRDTKVISTVFERLCNPVIHQVAKHHGYAVELANQTTYPDFTLTLPHAQHRIGIDVKTTYKQARMKFTLGSYTSFLQNGTKNILHPYSTYDEHWILGFIYSHRPQFSQYDLDSMPSRDQLHCPYKHEAVFLRRKHEIAGLRAGSGNTANIGSVALTDAQDFHTHKGPFTSFSKAKEACDHYWKHYNHYKSDIHDAHSLWTHSDFAAFK